MLSQATSFQEILYSSSQLCYIKSYALFEEFFVCVRYGKVICLFLELGFAFIIVRFYRCKDTYCLKKIGLKLLSFHSGNFFSDAVVFLLNNNRGLQQGINLGTRKVETYLYFLASLSRNKFIISFC